MGVNPVMCESYGFVPVELHRAEEGFHFVITSEIHLQKENHWVAKISDSFLFNSIKFNEF